MHFWYQLGIRTLQDLCGAMAPNKNDSKQTIEHDRTDTRQAALVEKSLSRMSLIEEAIVTMQ